MIQFPCKDISMYIKYLQMPRTVTTSRESTSMVTSIEYIRLLYAFWTLFRFWQVDSDVLDFYIAVSIIEHVFSRMGMFLKDNTCT